MPRYAVVARDPQVDLYREDDFYGAEVVETDSPEEAMAATHILKDLEGLQVFVVEVAEGTELGWHDSQDYEVKT